MSNVARFLWPPLIIMVAALLSRRWPDAMRRGSHLFAAINGVALLCIIATGWLPRTVPVAAIHRWLPHGLLILDWIVIAFAIGEILARFRKRPLAAAVRVFGLLVLLGLLFLASITGYLGPSYGRLEPMTFRRFQILHYCVWPAIGVALVIWWCVGTGERLSTSRRRWLRLSVRGLIVLVLVIGTELGWVVHGARVERDAVAAIQRQSGSVHYH
jgi:hypothetical protein